MQLRGKDASLHDFLMKLKAVSIHGRPYLLGTLTDITEQMKVQAQLRESQGFLHAIIENIPNMIFVKDIKELRFMEFNRAGEELIGCSRHEMLGKSDFDLFPKDEADSFTTKDREALESRQIIEIPEEIINTRGKGPRIVHTKKIPILDDAGEPKYLLGVSEDITENVDLRAREKELETQLRQLHKMEAIGTLAGGIAHDFNNILGIIMGNAEMALFDAPEESPVYNHIEQVTRAAIRARDLVQQILIFSRRSEHEQRPLSIAPIVKETLKLLRSSLPSTIEIRQIINILFTEDSVLADPTQIHQVLMNLCMNASHAMRETGGILEVEYSCVDFTAGNLTKPPDLDPGSYLVLRVSDTGHGMNKEVMDRIFEPYFSTKEQEEGTGLGLAVVHGIVKKHAGAITVTSTPEKGSTFRVYFPKRQGRSEKPEEDLHTPLQKGTESILLVDDEPALLEAVQQMLQRLGYTVVPRASGVEALREFQARPDAFHLVITDQTMPKMTGLELSKQLVVIRPDLPLILCTGFSDSPTPEKRKAVGIRALVMKPIVLSDLASTIRKVLGGEEVD
jgi:PAS domain S-box-containing protein